MSRGTTFPLPRGKGRVSAGVRYPNGLPTSHSYPEPARFTPTPNRWSPPPLPSSKGAHPEVPTSIGLQPRWYPPPFGPRTAQWHRLLGGPDLGPGGCRAVRRPFPLWPTTRIPRSVPLWGPCRGGRGGGEGGLLGVGALCGDQPHEPQRRPHVKWALCCDQQPPDRARGTVQSGQCSGRMPHGMGPHVAPGRTASHHRRRRAVEAPHAGGSHGGGRLLSSGTQPPPPPPCPPGPLSYQGSMATGHT